MTPSTVSFNVPNMFGAIATVNLPGLQSALETPSEVFETAQVSSLTFSVSMNSPQSIAGVVLVTTAILENVMVTYEGSPTPIDMVMF